MKSTPHTHQSLWAPHLEHQPNLSWLHIISIESCLQYDVKQQLESFCNCNHVCACVMAGSLFTPDYKYLYISLSPPHNNSDRWTLGGADKHFIQILLARVGSLNEELLAGP